MNKIAFMMLIFYIPSARAMDLLFDAIEIDSTDGVCGMAAIQGLRPTMEDAMECHMNEDHAFFGVYDGHRGRYVADFAKYNLRLLCNLHGASEDDDIKFALGQGFLRTHCFLGDRGTKTGSTATVAVIKNQKIFVANTGDSRTVLCNAGTAIALSNDHKPYRSDEWQRIIDAGGYVVHVNGAYRVQGALSLSRALGDKYLYPYVIPHPEITVTQMDSQDEFLILACDGVWDVLDDRDAVAFVRRKMVEYNDEPQKAARALIDYAYRLGSTDNISAVVVNLKPFVQDYDEQ